MVTPSKPDFAAANLNPTLPGMGGTPAPDAWHPTEATQTESSGQVPSPGSEPPLADADRPSPGYSPGYGWAGYPTTGLEGRGAHLLDYVRVLYRRRYVAVTAFTLVVVASGVHTYTRIPIYQATAQIEIDYESPKVVPFRQVTDSDFAGWDTQEYYQTQYKILQSRSLARRTLDGAKLWKHPRLTGRPAGDGGPLPSPPPANGGDGDKAEADHSSYAVPETPAETPIINAFLGGVSVVPVRTSRLVDLKYSSTDPEFAALAVNALAKAYIEQNLDFRFKSSKDASTWLTQQMSEQRKEVEASERKLQEYRERTDSVSLEDKQNITLQKLADLNQAVTRAKTDRLQKEALFNQVKAIEHDRAALDTFPAVLSNTFIQQLKVQAAELQRQRVALAEKYGEKHPEMIRLRSQIEEADGKIQGEIGKIVRSIRSEYEAALSQERSLVAALEQQKGEAMDLSRKGIDYGVLQRDANTNRQMFDSLLQRAKETGVSAELKSSNIRIVDGAIVPGSPISPNKSRNLLLAIIEGGALALGLVFLFEYLDNRVKSPEEIKRYLHLPFLGLVPALDAKHTAQNALIHSEAPAPFAEAFRGIRTNVLFSSTEEGGRSIVVTSTAPSEGKTLVATNLAVALAQASQRVLLLDGDMRKPRVHEVFSQPRVPGLSNVLVGNAKASEAVRQGPVANLWLLPSGVTPPNPAELLASQRFKDFIATLEEHFDWVIVDSPPAIAVTDASVIAHVVHGVVFVVRCERTNKHTALTALEQLQSAKAKFLGGILNRVDVRRNPYYYAHYYKKAYTAYYGTKQHT
jgi:succinoglycan biosynthesis transport protein ExoP